MISFPISTNVLKLSKGSFTSIFYWNCFTCGLFYWAVANGRPGVFAKRLPQTILFDGFRPDSRRATRFKLEVQDSTPVLESFSLSWWKYNSHFTYIHFYTKCESLVSHFQKVVSASWKINFLNIVTLKMYITCAVMIVAFLFTIRFV